MSRSARGFQSEIAVWAACAVSFALGLFFIFVWAPHPWGWEGFDHYHDLARVLAAGRAFPTLDVPWGYAYFLAGFYRVFGDRPWIPLIVQAALNASIPFLTYRFAVARFDRRTAVAAAVLTGLFSFNTVYASTQSSDAICTWLFMLAILVYAEALDRRSGRGFVAAGALLGLAAQFRPNLIVMPVLLAAFTLRTQVIRRWRNAVAIVAAAGVMLLPWVVRNYRLTREVLPTSVHGAVQLWYGTLQVGPYLHSRAYNPRSVFEAPAFSYTSLDRVPIIVDADFHCTERPLAGVALTYRVDQDVERQLAPSRVEGQSYRFNIPPQRLRSVMRYVLTSTWSDPSGAVVRTTPLLGARAPLVYFVTDDHLGDADRDGDLLDVFDVVRLARRDAWGEPLAFDARLRAAGAGSVAAAADALLRPVLGLRAAESIVGVESDAREARVVFADRSQIVVPRRWNGTITELVVTEGMASTIMTSRHSLQELTEQRDHPAARVTPDEACLQSVDVAINQEFYRREPQMMRRYAALAWDNIRRDPRAFLSASAFRAGRLFIIEGADDPSTAHQFTHSGRIYALAAAASAIVLALCVAGIAIGWWRGDPIALPFLLIVSVPATLAPVLINMRYTVTIQPLMFMFRSRLRSPVLSQNDGCRPASDMRDLRRHRTGAMLEQTRDRTIVGVKHD